MIRVLIADDHMLIREGLKKIINRETDISLVAEAGDTAEAIEAVKRLDMDVAVLDFNMPGRSGLDAISSIHALKPKLPILILSMIPEKDLAIRVFKAGGAGFISKESSPEELISAIRLVASGKKYVSSNVAEYLAAGLWETQSESLHDKLSNRELLVLRMISSGKATKAIAAELSLSINTIATYRRRILAKLHLTSDVDITRYAIKHHLTD